MRRARCQTRGPRITFTSLQVFVLRQWYSVHTALKVVAMTRDNATAAVREVLDAIDTHRWRDLHVPHGFAVREITAEPRRNPFMPDLHDGWAVKVDLDVPVIYTPDSSRGRVRASLPADRDNLAALQAWIVAQASESWARIALGDWRVSPDEAPAPYLDSGEAHGPPAEWTVSATFSVN